MKKQRIILLSDLWGNTQSEWKSLYTEVFDRHAVIKFIDVCSLAEIDMSSGDQETIHQQFIDGGIERALAKCMNLIDADDIVIGCSIGGIIAWKAALEGTAIKKLICVSTTRLRYETTKPNIPITTLFGNTDPYKPDESWASKLEVQCILLDGDHDIYKNPALIRQYLLPSVSPTV